jgi:hypothetical protein
MADIKPSWPFFRNWTWTAQVFFTLHLLAMFMKMHSYAFYNGHLSEIRRRLRALDNPNSKSTVTSKVDRYPGTRTEPLSPTSKQASEKDDLSQLREELAYELTSPLGHVTYPQNLTVSNYADYLLCPTLCYELEYPRTDGIQLMELFYKSLAVFGCIFLMTVTSEEFVIPVLDESALRLQRTQRFGEGSLILAETISRLLFPFMVIFLLVFLVIFEYVLGAFAEISCETSPVAYTRPLKRANNDMQVSRIGNFTQTGGTVQIGWSSHANGTFQSITFSDDMCTAPLVDICRDRLRPSSLFSSARSLTNLSCCASPRSCAGTALLP